MKRFGAVLVLAAFLGCTDPLDPVGNVHDLRLLAMRADPPEQRVGDLRPVKVTALIANPPGEFLVGCTWVTCAEQDSATSRCLETSPGFSVLDAGEFSVVQTGPDGAESSVTFQPDLALLKMIGAADPYRGLAGVRQVVQVELRAGAETVVGFKRVVFTIPTGAPVALNQNPVVGPIEFNDAGWAPDASVTFELAPVRMPGRMPPGTPQVSNHLVVLEDKSLQEDYSVRTFEGETRVLHETWRYSFFASRGSFNPTSAGGANLLNPDAGVDTFWSPISNEDGGSGATTVWIVVRDGRGGESWVVRHALAP